MRITSGILKNLKLEEAEGLAHPMGERVRTALFNIVYDNLVGARVLDVCAGVGSIGIEAWSRGASIVDFIEKDEKMFRILNRNISTARERAIDTLNGGVFRGDANRVMHDILTNGVIYDIIVIDAPYELYEDRDFSFELIKNGFSLLNHSGWLIVSSPKEIKKIVDFEKIPESSFEIKTRKYAGAYLNFMIKLN